MPAPVFLLPLIAATSKVLRIPAIAVFFGGLAAQLVAWFSVFVSRNIALNLAVIAFVVGLAVAIAASFWLMLEGISYVLPPEFSRAMGMITPSNAIPCLSTVASAKIARWVWMWQIYAIHRVTG
ncbi:DUF5455 family protein [Aliivibrio logei]|uniref:Uncharacterized protein n=1 Tax=Aliivibrio logei TaxID=688 RepID=A0A1B9NTV2_ALILO|nr:DUF5455 family protein [Aliivibrio logei]OCH17125.1 hypothetical protein A6E04_19935 [Aliivibrio logei]